MLAPGLAEVYAVSFVCLRKHTRVCLDTSIGETAQTAEAVVQATSGQIAWLGFREPEKARARKGVSLQMSKQRPQEQTPLPRATQRANAWQFRKGIGPVFMERLLGKRSNTQGICTASQTDLVLKSQVGGKGPSHSLENTLFSPLLRGLLPGQEPMELREHA